MRKIYIFTNKKPSSFLRIFDGKKSMYFQQSNDLLKQASIQAEELKNALNIKFSALDSLSLNNPVLSPIIANAKEAMIKGDFLDAKSYLDKIYEMIQKNG